MTSRPHTTIEHEQVLEPFTIVPNRILHDERLALDEKALLSVFLSFPPGWTVVPAHIRKTQKIGRDKFYRMVQKLVHTGYMTVEKVRAEDGTIIGFRYAARALPRRDAECPIEAVEDVESRDPLPENKEMDDQPLPENPEVGISPLPDYPFPDFQDTVINTDKIIIHPLPPQTEGEAAPQAAASPPRPAFAALSSRWPAEHILSPHAAERSFVRLNADAQRLAIERAGNYLDHVRGRGWKVCDLKAYIRERRWEGLQAATKATAVLIRGGTPQAARWVAYKRAMGLPTADMEQKLRFGQPYYERTEWPPAVPAKTTGPPPDSQPESTDRKLAKG